MAENGFLGADTSIYKQPQQDNPFMSGLKMAGGMTALQTGQFDLHMKQLAATRDQLSSLLMDPALNPNDPASRTPEGAARARGAVIDTVGKLVANGILPPQMAATELGRLPQDVMGIRNVLMQHALANQQATERLRSIYGNMTAVGTGDGTQFVNVNPITNKVTQSGGNAPFVQSYNSPEANSARAIIGYDSKSGAAIWGTARQAQENARDTRSIRPGTAGAPAGAPGQGGAGAPPPAAGGAGAAPPAGAGATPSPASGATAAPPQGIVAPIEGAPANLQADYKNSADKIQGIQPLLNAIPLVDKLGQNSSGPSSQAEADLKAFLVTRGWLKPDQTDVDVRQEADKYFKQYVGKSGVGGAGGSDYRTAFASGSNPSLGTNLNATAALARMSVALDRMEAARPLAFNGNINQYGEHMAKWTQSQDPRAYGLDVMPPEKRQKLLDEMRAKIAKNPKDPEAKKFWDSVAIADQHGLLTGAANGQ